MPKMAKNGQKWPKFGPNTCNFDIFKLEMSQNYVESHTDCPETIFQKSKIFDMPKMAQNGYFGHKKLRLILLAKIRAKRTSPSFSEAFLLSVCKKSVKKYQNIRCNRKFLTCPKWPKTAILGIKSCVFSYWPKLGQNGPHHHFQRHFYCPYAKNQSRNTRI